MAAFDFPHVGLTVGQLYPNPAVAGQVQYLWDGEKWTTTSGLANSTAFVKIAGDTMTGNLNIVLPQPTLMLGGTAGNANTVMGQIGGKYRWTVNLGNGITESGSNAGSDFTIGRHNDAGTHIGNAFTLTRSDGTASFSGSIWAGVNVNASNVVTTGVSGTTGAYYFGNTGTKALSWDGSAFQLLGGALNTSSVVRILGGTCYFGSGDTYLTHNGTNFYVGGGNLYVIAGGTAGIGAVANGLYCDGSGMAIRAFGNNAISLQNSGGSNTYAAFGTGGLSMGAYGITTTGGCNLNGIAGRAGVNGTVGPNSWSFYWNNTALQMHVDSSYIGTVNTTSDYRIKKDVIDLPGMWDTVKALRPIKYTQAQFSPPSHIEYIAKEQLKARAEAEENPDVEPREVNTAPLYAADDIERWGFIAHELQETLIENAATGVKDSPDTVQSPNPWTVIAALTKALQEAMTRIEALEAGG